ncbi:MAG: hypothetical protein Q9162_003585 [Coniocarpon cinnabarinum]
MAESQNTPEGELESFRRQWQEEVRKGKRNKPTHASSSRSNNVGASSSTSKPSTKLKPPAGSAIPVQHDEDDSGPEQGYHDLENKEDSLRLNSSPVARKAATAVTEPQSALEHYEMAVERETAGNLGDSVSHYRKAFRLDSGVTEAYKKKHFPAPPKPASIPHAQPNPSNASATVPNTAHHSLAGKAGEGQDTAPASLNDLLTAFSTLSIASADPVIENTPAPPCPIATLPSEVLLRILQATVDIDVATLPCLALVCRKLAYLVTTEDSLWKPTVLSFPSSIFNMHYRYTLTIPHSQVNLAAIDPFALNNPRAQIPDLTPSTYPSYRAQFRHRPRLRFGGCYISNNNYTRPGVPAQDRKTWNSPVHIVTYYRYLRFYRDGSCIILQTTAEPGDVVHHLTKETLEDEKRREKERHGAATANMPSIVMRDALLGRWRLSGPASGPAPRLEDEDEPLGKRPGEYAKEPVSVFESSLVDDVEPVEDEGTLHVETEGVNSKYLWKMEFAIGSSGRRDGTRNNRLAWRGFWSYNRLADDWGEFGLKNDKSLYWSRVKSWGIGE